MLCYIDTLNNIIKSITIDQYKNKNKLCQIIKLRSICITMIQMGNSILTYKIYIYIYILLEQCSISYANVTVLLENTEK